MRHRIDGIETRHRILEAACAVFARKGYRDATVAEICRQAGTNTASVNYHFRDKESLYVEVWRHAAERAGKLYPFDGGVSADAPAAERLRGHLQALLQRMTDTGQLGHFHRLHTMEMTNPTGIVDDVVREIRQPYRDELTKVLRELLGPNATAREAELCEISLVGQCLKARFGPGPRFSRAAQALSPGEIAELAEHITRFSLGGIDAVRRRRAEAAREPVTTGASA